MLTSLYGSMYKIFVVPNCLDKVVKATHHEQFMLNNITSVAIKLIIPRSHGTNHLAPPLGLVSCIKTEILETT